MKTNKLIKVKLSIISLSLVFNIIYACGSKFISPEAERFENMLQITQLIEKDSVNYVYWTQHSCGGCRSLCTRIILTNIFNKTIKLIVPPIHEGGIMQLDTNKYFIDNANVFGKKYLGIDNIGIIKTSNGKVYSIKNYNPNEMEKFKVELLN